MGLKDIKIPEELVKTPGGDFAVRGLSLDDILTLAGRHLPLMSELFDTFSGNSLDAPDGSFDKATTGQVAAALARTAPDAVADVITLAGGYGLDDKEALKAAKNLPFPVQIDALEKVGKLTFTSEDALGKSVAAVVQMMQGASKSVALLRVAQTA